MVGEESAFLLLTRTFLARASGFYAPNDSPLFCLKSCPGRHLRRFWRVSIFFPSGLLTYFCWTATIWVPGSMRISYSLATCPLEGILSFHPDKISLARCDHEISVPVRLQSVLGIRDRVALGPWAWGGTIYGPLPNREGTISLPSDIPDQTNPGLTKTDGTLTLAGSNCYTGGTTVNGGTLTVAVTDGVPDGSTLTVGPGATLILTHQP